MLMKHFLVASQWSGKYTTVFGSAKSGSERVRLLKVASIFIPAPLVWLGCCERCLWSSQRSVLKCSPVCGMRPDVFHCTHPNHWAAFTQVTWIYEPKDGERINIAVFLPNYDPNYPDSPVKGRVSFAPSPPNVVSPSIEISNVGMTDEGKYICEYATYPSGNEQGITHLVMLGEPWST